MGRAGAAIGQQSASAASALQIRLPRIVQTSDASCEHRDGLRAEVVERGGALDVETFIRAERDLGGDRPNGAGDRSDDDPVEVCGGEVATDDQHRPTLVLGFGPPDVTLTGPRVQFVPSGLGPVRHPVRRFDGADSLPVEPEPGDEHANDRYRYRVCYDVFQMKAEDLGWLPPEGVHLDRDELARVVVALRALIDGSEPDEPNRAHAVTIAYVVADAIERTGGTG